MKSRGLGDVYKRQVSSSKITKGESYTVYTTTDSVDASSTTLASNATSLGSFTAS